MGRDEFFLGLGSILFEYAKNFGGFMKAQAYVMISDKHPETIDKLLHYMVSHKKLHKRGEHEYTVSVRTEMDYGMIRALWVFLDQKKDRDDIYYYAAPKPSNIGYLKDNTVYEIMAVNQGETGKLELINNRIAATEKEVNHGTIRYIIAIPNIKVMKSLPELRCDYIFAVVPEDTAYGEAPEITYYAGKL